MTVLKTVSWRTVWIIT